MLSMDKYKSISNGGKIVSYYSSQGVTSTMETLIPYFPVQPELMNHPKESTRIGQPELMNLKWLMMSKFTLMET